MHHSSATELVALTSFRGQLAFSGSNDPDLSKIFQRDWLYLGFPLTGNESKTGSPFAVYPASIPKSVILFRPQFNSPSYRVQNGSTNYEITVPYWLLVLMSATPAIAPWVHWRFTLRTLLIAMTLVAVVLGLIVALLR
jgi:hypothetical protein